MGSNWLQQRDFIGKLPPSWRLALLRVWTASLLTSSRTGKGHSQCLFCSMAAADRFRHIIRCEVVRALVARSLGVDAASMPLVTFLGLDARSLRAAAIPVFLALLYQKRRHCEESETARYNAVDLLIKPLSKTERMQLQVQGMRMPGQRRDRAVEESPLHLRAVQPSRIRMGAPGAVA